MRLSLRWALGLTVSLTAAVLWWDQSLQRQRITQVMAIASAQIQQTASVLDPGFPDAVGRSPIPMSAPLPSKLNPLNLAPARRDVFMLPEPPKSNPPPAPVVTPVVTPEPAVPMAPAVSYRFLGRMRTPAGAVLTLLQKADQPWLVRAGTQLDDGYEVTQIDKRAVRLLHKPTGTVVDLPIPPAPDATFGW